MRHRDFDAQARSFDRRAGLPGAACEAIAAELVHISSPAPADIVLEVGAGTGQIGQALCAKPLRYLGIDASPMMLAEFARRCRQQGFSAPIAVADASRTWPARDGSVRVVFGSRSLHLLPLQHVVDEIVRVSGQERTYVLIGRVERAPDGLRARLRRAMHDSVRRRGHVLSEGRQQDRALLDALMQRGGRAIEPRPAARWPVRRSAGELIASWRKKSGLAGIDIPTAEKDVVLSELAAWAEKAIGALDVAESNEEKYMISGVELRAHPSGIVLQ